MKTKILFFVFCLLIGVTLLLEAANKIGDITEIEGKVVIIRAKDGGEEKAVKGSILEEGDKVKTFFASTAKVKLTDGSVIDIKPSTTMDFNKVKVSADGEKKVNVNLWFGKSKFDVSKLQTPTSTFEVKTPVAVCGVRGTDFGVAVEPSKTTNISVFKGMVSVKNAAGEVFVKENQTTTVKPNQAPEAPQKLSDEQINEWQVGEKVEEEKEAEKGEEIIKLVSDFPHITNKRTIKIRGSVAAGVKVSVNDEDISISGNTFEKELMLVDGLNKIKIVAVTADGKKQTITKEMILDTIPPSFLQIVRPLNFDFGGVWNKPTLPIIGFTDKDNKVKIDNKPVELDSRGQFKINLPLRNGDNRIKIEVEDEGGNVYTKYSGNFIVDFEPPVVQLSSPTQNQIFSTTNINVSGKTEVGATLIIKLNGNTVIEKIVDSSGIFNEIITASGEGQYIVAVQAKDAANNISTPIQRTVRVDLNPPILTLTKNEVQGNNLIITIKSNEKLATANLTATGISQANISGPTETISNNYYYYTWTINLSGGTPSAVIMQGTDFANKTSSLSI